MFALDLLSIPLSNHMLFRGQMTLIGTPVVGEKPRDSEWLQQFLGLEHYPISTIAQPLTAISKKGGNSSPRCADKPLLA
jgi:hypothetical protein